jgi:hypothetical protein
MRKLRKQRIRSKIISPDIPFGVSGLFDIVRFFHNKKAQAQMFMGGGSVPVSGDMIYRRNILYRQGE